MLFCCACWAIAVGALGLGAGHPFPRSQAPAPGGQDALAPGRQGPDQQDRVPQSEQALVRQYCVTCHNARARTGGLSLEELDPAAAAGHSDVWEKVITKLRGGMMPPVGMPRPGEATLQGFAASLEQRIDRQALVSPDPGHKPIHRLNRTEYRNAVRDLLALEVDVLDLLPSDDESHGFDNIAGVLRVSSSLLEQYLTAARRVSSLAVGTDSEVVRLAYRVPPDDSQQDEVDGLGLGTRGGFRVRHNFPQDAEYELAVGLMRNFHGYVTGLEFAHRIEIAIDGEQVFTAQVGGQEDNLASDRNMSAAALAIEKRLTARVRVAAGPHHVGVTFYRRNRASSDEPLQLHERHHDLQDMNGLPIIDQVTLTGPFNPTGPGDTPSRRRIFTCRPETATAVVRVETARRSAEREGACAQTILTALAQRAYRRPATAGDLDQLMAIYAAGRAEGSTFDAGIEQALRLVLASPKFLFRVETPPAAPGSVSGSTSGSAQPGGVARVSDLELASRLSFFLWSSIPDEELLKVAGQGRLDKPAVLQAQVERMLKDPRSRALVDNFAAQWLRLRNLRSVTPIARDFPNFDNELREAFRIETELFFESIIRDDRSVVDLLNADYTYVNERLARHYGIPNVYGSHFRRVTVQQEARRGLLGHGSILTVTSYPNRTSPVLRGKWVLENILGTPPPAPPADVPDLEDNHPGEQAQSLRARLEAHRRSPNCASCHRVMDPLGFALENFDGLGQWREKEPGGAIDPRGQLADGTPIDGPVALRKAVLERREMFVRTLTEKLMTYGLGRGLELDDRPLVREVARHAAARDYRWSAIVLGIVRSAPFQMKKALAPASTAPQVATVAAR
jgi:mono/diheme cytochrome c family protein